MNKQLQTLFKEFEGIIGEVEVDPKNHPLFREAIKFRNHLRSQQRQQLEKLKDKYIKESSMEIEKVFLALVMLIVTITLIIGMFRGLFEFADWSNSMECKNKYASFENKYSLWERCQIKVNDKWIPSDSYYFKQE